MTGPRHPGPTPDVAPGGGKRWRPSLLHLALAFVIFAAGLSWLPWWSSPRDATLVAVAPSVPPVVGSATVAGVPPTVTAPLPVVTQQPVAATVAALPAPLFAAPAAEPTADVSRVRDPNGDLTPDISDFVNKGEKPTMGEVIDRLHQAGERGGLAAFSPPGTRPPLIGIAVPEDFPLPEGYVRHYQATDDGQRIEPILMFAPDRAFFDAANRPIAIPKDRVVPPELAPPGLPIRRIALPAPTEPGR